MASQEIVKFFKMPMPSNSTWPALLRAGLQILSRITIKTSKLLQLAVASSISQRLIALHLEHPQSQKTNQDIQTCKTMDTNKELSGLAVKRMKPPRRAMPMSKQLARGRQTRPKSSQTHITRFSITDHNMPTLFNLITLKMCKFLGKCLIQFQFKRLICPEIK